MLLHVLYLIGITAEAMTGALAAGRRRMDTFGVIIIATATAIGGGSVRDILLGHYPLGWAYHGHVRGDAVHGDPERRPRRPASGPEEKSRLAGRADPVYQEMG